MLKAKRGDPDVTEGDQLTLEREPVSLPHLHTWTTLHTNRIIGEFEASIQREPLLPMGVPLDHLPAPPTP